MQQIYTTVTKYDERQNKNFCIAKSLFISNAGLGIFGVSPSGKAREFDSRIHRFESCYPSSEINWGNSVIGYRV